jgi:hypothetical protein
VHFFDHSPYHEPSPMVHEYSFYSSSLSQFPVIPYQHLSILQSFSEHTSHLLLRKHINESSADRHANLSPSFRSLHDRRGHSTSHDLSLRRYNTRLWQTYLLRSMVVHVQQRRHDTPRTPAKTTSQLSRTRKDLRVRKPSFLQVMSTLEETLRCRTAMSLIWRMDPLHTYSHIVLLYG